MNYTNHRLKRTGHAHYSHFHSKILDRHLLSRTWTKKLKSSQISRFLNKLNHTQNYEFRPSILTFSCLLVSIVVLRGCMNISLIPLSNFVP